MLKVLIFGATCVALAVADHVVETTHGKLKGGEKESRDGRTYYEFLNIPYAKAERFQPPTAAEPWTEVRDATKFGSPCLQLVVDIPEGTNPRVVGSEDCLTANVYTPKLPQDGEHKIMLPVLVFFAGGIMHGSGNAFGAQYFMDTDSILVTFNSRLGALGFLDLDDEHASGNQGLKDQVALLKWVQENIEKFGGDKDRVTIFGSGQGAAVVHYHLLSEQSKGLFHNAISQSGSATAPWAFVRDPIHQAKRYAERLGCPHDTKENLLKCLKEKDAKDLVLTFTGRILDEFTDKDFIHFGPSIEHVDGAHAFLKESPHVLLAEGKVNKVPWITGVNDQDGANPLTIRAISDEKALQTLEEKFTHIMRNLVLFNHTATDPEAVAAKIKEFYFEGKPVSKETRLTFTDLIADRMFFAPALRAATEHAKHAPAFTYVIEKKSAKSMFDIFGLDMKPGSALFDELHHLFPIPTYKFDEITKDSPDYEYSKNLVQLWASFGEVNKPSKIWPDAKAWEQFDAAKMPVTLFSINDKTGDYVVDGVMLKRHAFWASLFDGELKAEEENPPKEDF